MKNSDLCYTSRMDKPKLVLLYGFASSGKTTLAKKYIDEHPLSIAIEGDQIIGMMGQWRKNEEAAREIVFKHTQAIVRGHLSSGYDVLLPYLLTNPSHAAVFQIIATENESSFHEIYLDIQKEDAIARLLARGVWGEEGSPKLTNDDLPEINNLYDTMVKAMSERIEVKRINSGPEDVLGTYQKFLQVISSG